MIGEQYFKSSEALDRLACMKHRGGIVGNGSDGVGIGIGINFTQIEDRLPAYKEGMLIGLMSLPKDVKFDSIISTITGEPYHVPDYRYVHVDDQFRPDSDAAAPFDVVQFLCRERMNNQFKSVSVCLSWLRRNLRFRDRLQLLIYGVWRRIIWYLNQWLGQNICVNTFAMKSLRKQIQYLAMFVWRLIRSRYSGLCIRFIGGTKIMVKIMVL